MATIYDLKPAFQNMLRPVCRWCAKHGISDATLTEWESRYGDLKRNLAPFKIDSRFRKLDRYLIIVLLCVVFGGLLIRDYLSPAMEPVVSGALGILAGAITLLWVYGDVRRGRTGYARLEVRREKHPILFWILIIIWSICGAAFTLAAVLYTLRN